MKRLSLVATLALLLLACERNTGRGGDWPSWRGPQQDGSAKAAGLSADRGVVLELAWERPLGPGFSSISIAGGVAVTMDSDGEFDQLVALRADSGDELWRYEIAPTHRQEHPEATDGPLGTPTIHDGMVYGVGPRGDLFAVDLADGQPLWSLRIDEQLGAQAEQFGFATSPIVIAGTLIVPTGAGDGRSTCGLDPRTGDVRWCHGSDPVGYQSPLAYGGAEPRVVVATDRHMYSLDPATGEELWQVEHIVPVVDGYTQVLPLGGDRFVAYYLGWAAGYEISQAPAGAVVDEVWRTADLRRNLAAPVALNGRLYGFLRDSLTCLDASTGEQLWIRDDIVGRGLITVGDLLAVWQSDGTLLLAAPAPDGLRELARIATGLENGYTSPSYADGRFFVRNLERIAAIRLSAEG